MKTIILAGGFGARISEESHLRPKPMIEIGGSPILWHILKWYSYHGVNDFIICCGYMGSTIKEYFADYYLHRSDVTFDFTANNKMIIHFASMSAKPIPIRRGSHSVNATLYPYQEGFICGVNTNEAQPYQEGFTFGECPVKSVSIRSRGVRCPTFPHA